jgi:predicted homoserine dehydrogenase-like protein
MQQSVTLLSRLKSLQKGIKVGIVGMGSMGKGLFYQCQITPGIDCVAIADIDIDRAVACVDWMKLNYRVVEDLKDMHEATRQGFVAVCKDGDLVARCEMADVMIEASNSIGPAGGYAATALECGKHLVLMNAEIDLIFGPHLLRLAKDNGVVYTSCAGDQYSVIKRLIDDLRLWGFDLVMAGNIKGFLDRYSNPTKIVPEADKRNLSYKMATAYTDGTKLNIEMAILANATKLSALVPGMHGPPAKHVGEVFELFDFNALWAKRQPLVDYILGAEPRGGVFAVGHCDNPYQKAMLSYYKMGNGPFYLFYRPYHLCHIEAMECVADAVLEGRPLLQPTFGFQTNVYAYAKRHLRKGEKLDGIGGYTCYGLIENHAKSNSPGIPICLAEGVALTHDVAKDERILMRDVVCSPDSCEFTLYSHALNESRS